MPDQRGCAEGEKGRTEKEKGWVRSGQKGKENFGLDEDKKEDTRNEEFEMEERMTSQAGLINNPYECAL